MEVGMKKQVLSPTMEYSEKADLGSQMFGIASDGGQGLGGGSKQNAVNDLFVLISDGSNLFGDREDDMKIVCLENFGCSLFNPLGTRVIGTSGNGGRDSCCSKAARNYSSRNVRDDRRELRSGTP